MKWAWAITSAVSVCLFVGTAVVTTKYLRQRYAVQPFPLLQDEAVDPVWQELPQRTNIKLSQTEIDGLLSGSCSAIRSPEELPQPIKNAFAFLTDDKPFALAVPGARFNATDVIEPGFPRRRLVLGGQCEERWFIEYEHGGIGMTFPLLVLRENSDHSVSFVWGTWLKTRAPTLVTLRTALANKEFWEGPHRW